MKLKDKDDTEKRIAVITSSEKIDDEQVSKIASLPSYRWAKDALQQCKDKIKELSQEEKKYKALLKKPNDIRAIFRQEVLDLKKQKFNKA